MFHKIREAQQGEREEGFTLIELLVVVIIIGILAAIAIPVFLNQREKARNSAANSDLRNMITAQEAYYTDNDNYAAVTGAANGEDVVGDDGFTSSNEVLICVDEDNANDRFYVEAYHTNGSVTFWYQSDLGTIEKDTSGAADINPTATALDCTPAA